MRQHSTKIFIALLVIAGIAAFFAFGGPDVFTLANVKAEKARFVALYANNAWIFAVGFMLVYIVCTALSIPVATFLTLLSGAVFGFGFGLLLSSFASAIGATLAFLLARYLLRENLQSKYGDKLMRINQGIEEEGGFYLFALRLVPLFPFFLINFLYGLTPVKTRSFYWISQLGMLPGTAVYVYAGTELSKVDNLKDIVSPGLLVAFALLGVLPIVSKKLVAGLKSLRSDQR